MLHIKSNIRLAFLAIVSLALFNGFVILHLHNQPRQKTVKGLHLTEVGEIELHLAGLLQPASDVSFDVLKDPIINPHDFKYIHSPFRICYNKTVNLLVGIVSSPVNFWQRNRGRQFLYKYDGVAFVFILGMAERDSIQKRIDLEVRKFRDVLQEPIIDVSRNLSLKSVAFLKWANIFCSHAKFVVKKDDDIELDPNITLYALMKKKANHPHFIMGNSKFLVEGPIRDQLSKYFTSFAEFGDEYFPMFVHGPAYGFPIETAKVLYEITLRTKLFWLEDVYITGICAHKANIPVFFDVRFMYEHAGIDMV